MTLKTILFSISLLIWFPFIIVDPSFALNGEEEELVCCSNCSDGPEANWGWCHHFGENNLCFEPGVTCDGQVVKK